MLHLFNFLPLRDKAGRSTIDQGGYYYQISLTSCLYELTSASPVNGSTGRCASQSVAR